MIGRRRRGRRSTATAAPPTVGVDLLAALAASEPGREVQCPACGSLAHLSPPSAGGPDGSAHTCEVCGRQWKVAPGAPLPDVVVDASCCRGPDGAG